MSNSEKVKKWRESTKIRIVEAMGGKCAYCGYDKCNDALALHHLNPEEKEMSFSKIRANPKSWEAIVNELRKCILLCHNCHSEVHAGFVTWPEIKNYFNEDFAEYREVNPKTFVKSAITQRVS